MSVVITCSRDTPDQTQSPTWSTKARRDGQTSKASVSSSISGGGGGNLDVSVTSAERRHH